MSAPCTTLPDLTITVAVFYSMAEGERLDLLTVHLEADASETWTAEAVARGYRYAGVLAVTKGIPRVEIEPGCAAVVAAAGYVFAGMLGPLVKEHQLRHLEQTALAGEKAIA